MGQQRKIKQERREYKERQEAFTKEIQALSAKYKIDMVAALQYKQMALVPVIVMVDMKDQYQQMSADAKAAEAKKAGETKLQAQNKESESPAVPKLEV